MPLSLVVIGGVLVALVLGAAVVVLLGLGSGPGKKT
jgi:hypothetical protein